MPTLDDIAGATGKGKQELQQALLDLLKGNPDILNSVANSASRQGGQAAERAEIVSIFQFWIEINLLYGTITYRHDNKPTPILLQHF